MIKYPVSVEEQPFEVRSRRTIRSLLSRIIGLYEAIYDRYGDDGLDLIREVSQQYGQAIADRARGDGEPWDIKTTGLFLLRIFNNVPSSGEVTEFNDDRVEILVEECPYPMRNVEICKAHTTMEETVVKGLNPELDYTIEKSIPAGDKICLHVIHTKQSV